MITPLADGILKTLKKRLDNKYFVIKDDNRFFVKKGEEMKIVTGIPARADDFYNREELKYYSFS